MLNRISKSISRKKGITKNRRKCTTKRKSTKKSRRNDK